MLVGFFGVCGYLTPFAFIGDFAHLQTEGLFEAVALWQKFVLTLGEQSALQQEFCYPRASLSLEFFPRHPFDFLARFCVFGDAPKFFEVRLILVVGKTAHRGQFGLVLLPMRGGRSTMVFE